jgi:lipopolysaccharide export system protein LptC
LPGIAVIVMSIALLWPSLQRTRDGVESSVKSTIAASKLGNFMMQKPKYFGIDKEGRPFKIEAKSARQHGPNSDNVSLVAPKGNMTLASGNWVAMQAKAGEYDQKTKVLILTGDVNVYHDAKYTFKTEKATVDVKTNDAWGDKPVVVNGPKANIEAEGFRVKDEGKTVLFIGKSKVILHVDNQDLKDMTAGDTKADPKAAPKADAKPGTPPAKGDKQ